MDDKKVIAIKKAVKDTLYKKLSKDFPSGECTVDFMVRVHGTIKKGEDYEQVIAQKAKPWALFALAMSKLNGVTVESIVREFCEDEKVDDADVKESAEKALTVIKGTANQTCQGKITSKLEMEEVILTD